jgi:hypothetical protein
LNTDPPKGGSTFLGCLSGIRFISFWTKTIKTYCNFFFGFCLPVWFCLNMWHLLRAFT